MKNLSFVILILWIFPVNYQVTRNVKLYYIKITPIGISDSPRDLIYISMLKMDDITSVDLNENVGFINQIVTDEETLTKFISFIKENCVYKNHATKRYTEYGCFNISVYCKKSLIVSYNLERLAGVKYLQSLTKMLIENKSDLKVIKNLKEALGEIDY